MKVNLKQGVLPISKAASSLAKLLKHAQASGEAVVVTQKGYPTGIILSVDAYLKLKEAAEAAVKQGAEEAVDTP